MERCDNQSYVKLSLVAMFQKLLLKITCHWVLEYMPYYLQSLNCNCLQ